MTSSSHWHRARVCVMNNPRCHNGYRGHMTLGGALPGALYQRDEWHKPTSPHAGPKCFRATSSAGCSLTSMSRPIASPLDGMALRAQQAPAGAQVVCTRLADATAAFSTGTIRSTFIPHPADPPVMPGRLLNDAMTAEPRTPQARQDTPAARWREHPKAM